MAWWHYAIYDDPYRRPKVFRAPPTSDWPIPRRDNNGNRRIRGRVNYFRNGSVSEVSYRSDYHRDIPYWGTGPRWAISRPSETGCPPHTRLGTSHDISLARWRCRSHSLHWPQLINERVYCKGARATDTGFILRIHTPAPYLILLGVYCVNHARRR